MTIVAVGHSKGLVVKTIAHALLAGPRADALADFPTRRGPLGWLTLAAWAMNASHGDRGRAPRL